MIELYHKSQKEGLTPEEKEEQAALRKEYIASVKRNLKGQLDNIDMVNADGTVTTGMISSASEERSHLESQFDRPGAEAIGVANHQVARLAVIEHIVGIFRLLVGEVVLPVLVGQTSVCDMAFDMQPAVGKRQCPILR